MSLGNVAICAVAQTRFDRNLWNARFQELAFQCVDRVLAETGADFDEKRGIQAIVTCSDDVFDARTISDNAMTDAVGAHYRCEEKVAQDGANALGYALASILSGHEELVLLVGHCKESQSESRDTCTNLAFDPFYTRPLGLDYRGAAALQARAWLDRTKTDESLLADIVARAQDRAANNPRVTPLDGVGRDAVLTSELTHDPLRALHAYPVSDGAIAMLLANEERAASLTDKPVWIRGFANNMDHYYLGERDLSRSEALQRAALRAYSQAGVDDPAKLDVLEISDSYAHQLPLYLEAIGIQQPETRLEDSRFNPSGGTLAGSPLMLGGLARTLEAVLQLRGEADGVQLESPRRALAHGATGPAGQHQAVVILEAA